MLSQLHGDTYQELSQDNPIANDEKIKAPSLRWIMLAIFSSINFCNGMLWITFSPITTFTEEFYHINPNQVNLLSVLYMVLYIPGSFHASWTYKHYGCRFGCISAGFGNAVSGWIRLISVYNQRFGYLWLVLGQSIGAFCQPSLTNVPAKITGIWFPLYERNIATAIAASFNPLGVAVGSIIPSVLVSKGGHGMGNLLLAEALLSSVTFLVGYFFLKEEPEQPPSRAAFHRRQNRNLFLARSQSNSTPDQSQILLDPHAESSETPDIMHEFDVQRQIVKCLRDSHFWLLILSFGLGLGMFNAFTTLIEQLIRPYGYSQSDASLFGASLLLFGLLNAGIAGLIMDTYHAYNTGLKVTFTVSAIITLLLVFSLRENNTVILFIIFGLLGSAMLPNCPIAFNCGVECTFPVQEEVSTGLLMTSGSISGQIFGIFLTLGIGFLIDQEARTVEPNKFELRLSSIVILVVSLLCAFISWFYNGPYKRLDVDN